MSKFKGILDAAKGKEAEAEPESENQDISQVASKKSTASQRTRVRKSEKPPLQQPPQQKVDNTPPPEKPQPETKRGRPKAKRSDPNYVQVTAYLRKYSHTAVKIELLKDSQNGEKREFSELIQELLDEWLESRS